MLTRNSVHVPNLCTMWSGDGASLGATGTGRGVGVGLCLVSTRKERTCRQRTIVFELQVQGRVLSWKARGSNIRTGPSELPFPGETLLALHLLDHRQCRWCVPPAGRRTSLTFPSSLPSSHEAPSSSPNTRSPAGETLHKARSPRRSRSSISLPRSDPDNLIQDTSQRQQTHLCLGTIPLSLHLRRRLCLPRHGRRGSRAVSTSNAPHGDPII